MAKPTTSNDQSPKSKPSRRLPVAMRTLTEPSDIVLLLGPDTKRSDTSRGLVAGDRCEVQWNSARLPPLRNQGAPDRSIDATSTRFGGRRRPLALAHHRPRGSQLTRSRRFHCEVAKSINIVGI
jgi:hypothetical protein